MPSIHVIVVNWNSGRLLAEALQALSRSELGGLQLRVTVVDNGSTDGSAAISGLPLSLEILENADNRGFAAACNQGAQGSDADYLLFLNPDTRVEADSLRVAVGALENQASAGVGVVGVQLIDDSGAVARSCARFPGLRHFAWQALGLARSFPRVFPGVTIGTWDHLESRVVDHVIGAFYLMRRELFQRLSGFDERFFVYLEDLDFSLRARQLGACCYYSTETHAYHQGGGTSDRVRGQRSFYSMQSRLRYVRKHLGAPSLAAMCLITFSAELAARVVASMVRRQGTNLHDVFVGYRLLLVSMLRGQFNSHRQQVASQ
jgi:GT2 family glycosyltransferase